MIVRIAFAVFLLACSIVHGWAADPVTATVLLRSDKTNVGGALVYPRTDKPEITTMIVEIAPGASTSLHRHPVPSVAYMLQGDLEVRAAGDIVNRYKVGDAFLEAIDHAHQGFNVGTIPVRILVTYIGVKGEPISAEVR
jgi:quercetin dioxygenase-like cupin family protein